MIGEYEPMMPDAPVFTASLRFPHFPVASAAGTSFKPEHIHSIRQNPGAAGFFEIHAENYMGAGGAPHALLTEIRKDYPVSLHGVCMSIGGPSPLDETHLSRFKALVDRYEPALISEHLAWSTHDDLYYNDLLPLPYTNATLAHVCEHIDRMQAVVGRQMLLENPSTYLRFARSDWSETGFITEIARRTGCGLLLDINNVFVSSANHQMSAEAYLDDFPLALAGEIHLAGHDVQADDEGRPLLIDSHDRPVADPVWRLYESVIARIGPRPTLIEWDADIPAWPVLAAEAAAAAAIMARHSASGQRHAAA